MNFWTSMLAVFIADAVMSAMKFSQGEMFFVLILTTAIYFMVQFVLTVANRWDNVG